MAAGTPEQRQGGVKRLLGAMETYIKTKKSLPIMLASVKQQC